MPPLNAIASLLLALILLVQHDGIGFSSAFHIIDARRHRITANSKRRVLSRTQIFSSNVANDETTEKTSMMTLNLLGEAVVTSKMAPTNNKMKLHAFFALPNAAPLLLRGSKNNQILELESIDTDLFKQYQQMCERVNAQAPTTSDRIFDVTTSGVKFPGLQIMAVATIGVKITSTTQSDLPGYEFVLIRDSTYAEGNRLFVWFFNKVTGKDKDTKDEPVSSSRNQTTQSLNRISVVPTTGNDITFESNANLRIQIKFPSILMKAIPGADKEKSEKTGGESLRKVLEDDIPAALEEFRQEYVRWLES